MTTNNMKFEQYQISRNIFINIYYQSEGKINKVDVCQGNIDIANTKDQRRNLGSSSRFRTKVIETIAGKSSFDLGDFDCATLSAFQKNVYRELMNTKSGDKITYQDLAVRVNRKGAARAIGTAMAKNPFPFLIPCHRVIRSDGQIGNYSGEGGSKTKIELIKFEEELKNRS